MSHDLYSGVSEQSKASTHRLDDARALLNAERWRGAMYIAMNIGVRFALL
jgi:hypothetical protein